MSFDPVTDSEIMEWHQKQGGAGRRMAGHATRMLRECIELCIAAGADPMEIHNAYFCEMAKAVDRGEFLRAHTLSEIIEEFVDVQLLATVFRSYFIYSGDLENIKRRKLDICLERQWQPDADGVLWRPGTKPASVPPSEPKSS